MSFDSRNCMLYIIEDIKIRKKINKNEIKNFIFKLYDDYKPTNSIRRLYYIYMKYFMREKSITYDMKMYIHNILIYFDNGSL